MKSRTRHAYVRRIDLAIGLLQQAIDRNEDLPDPAQLAEVAHLSPFHFHRVYRALTGETPGHTVARLRMLRAIRLLMTESSAVTEAALSAGYETPQAFSRAFRQWCGASPSEVRADPSRLRAIGERLERGSQGPDAPVMPLQVQIVSVEPIRLMAIRNRGDYADLDQAYSRLFAWAAGRGVVEQITGIYGLPWQDHRDVCGEDLEYECAVAIAADVSESDGVTAQAWGGGLWARAHHVGRYEDLEAFTDVLMTHWLPESGYMLRNVPIFHHYFDDPEQTPANLCRADVHLPIE